MSPFNVTGEIHRILGGKFFLDESENKIHVLEDHFGLLKDLEDQDDDATAKKLNSLQNSMYTEIVNAADIASGNRPDLINPTPAPESNNEELPPTTYAYYRIGVPNGQELKFENGKATLDGYDLSDVELEKLLENVKNKKASLTKMDDMSKSEELFSALGHVKSAVKEGSLHPDVLRTLSKHIFTDSMIPSMGNKKAYEDFLRRPRAGVHVHIDLNDFGAINKLHGHNIGDSAIKSAGEAIRGALDTSVGRAQGKLFRKGGDEFTAFVPSYEHAARFLREMKTNFSKIPPVGGTHVIAASTGFGLDPESAESALIQAKTAKKAAGYKSGQSKSHSYSGIFDMEGHLSVD
jgi:GGDEF domain-containing protein